ncbi:MAG: uncharacterized protein KVP18_002752, partial [Porospora cf. gigantea A]
MNIVEEREGVETTVEEGNQKATVESTVCAEFEDKVDVDQTDAIDIVEKRVQSEVIESTVDEGHQKATVESTICAESEDKVDADQTDAMNIVEERE